MTFFRTAILLAFVAPTVASATEGHFPAPIGSLPLTGKQRPAAATLSTGSYEFINGRGRHIAGHALWYRSGQGLVTNTPNGVREAPDHLRLAYHGKIPVDHPGNAALAAARAKLAAFAVVSRAADAARRQLGELEEAHWRQLEGWQSWRTDAERISVLEQIKKARAASAAASVAVEAQSADAHIARATLALHPSDL